jgi:DNA-binding transcriptional LysR family regulator
MDKYRVTLTKDERADLEQLVSCGKAAARKLTHARILLLADDSIGQEHLDEQIVAALGTSPRTVSRVRQQLVTQGMDFALLRRRQPPRPDKIKIKGDVEQRLVELACSDPPTGRCHWTLQLLADELVVRGLVERVGLETVRQALKKTTSSRG